MLDRGASGPFCQTWHMTMNRAVGLLLSSCCALAIGACGGDEESASPAPTRDASAGGEACADVMVPGHEAVDVKATGTECGVAEKVAAAAEGRGRAAYESGGFACEPREASGGDTSYSCSMGPARVTFLYGTA